MSVGGFIIHFQEGQVVAAGSRKHHHSQIRRRNVDIGIHNVIEKLCQTFACLHKVFRRTLFKQLFDLRALSEAAVLHIVALRKFFDMSLQKI